MKLATVWKGIARWWYCLSQERYRHKDDEPLWHTATKSMRNNYVIIRTTSPTGDKRTPSEASLMLLRREAKTLPDRTYTNRTSNQKLVKATKNICPENESSQNFPHPPQLGPHFPMDVRLSTSTRAQVVQEDAEIWEEGGRVVWILKSVEH